ncbi:hypothetical protein [Nonomuraea sp. NPDC050786]|uniref:hypothetical protein n=1 Tax=Nonomuraea sp. NPDC050786 TaxID=3154840 RepID=UPI0033C077FC
MLIQRVHLYSDGTFALRPTIFRHVHPEDADAMAGKAGLALEERFGGWEEQPFTPDSSYHISVYVNR